MHSVGESRIVRAKPFPAVGAANPAAQGRTSWGAALAKGCAAAAVGFTAYHFLLQYLTTRQGLKLGAVSAKLAPLYAYWKPHYKTGLLLAAAVLALAVWRLARFITAEASDEGRAQTYRRLARLWPIWLMLVQLVVPPMVCFIDGKGLQRLAEPYTRTDIEYIGVVPLIDAPAPFLKNFVDRIPDFPMHAQTHPPGGPLFLWAVDRLIAPGPLSAAWATILFSALAVPGVAMMARQCLPERHAKLATVLFLLTPNWLLFSATSMEAVFAVPMIWSCACFLKAQSGWPLWWGSACGVFAAAACGMTFSAAFLPLWGLMMLGVSAFQGPRRRAHAGMALAAAALSFTLCFELLEQAFGYSVLHNLDAAVRNHRQIMDGMNQSSLWRHVHIGLANLAAFGFSIGLPIFVLWLHAVRRAATGGGGASKVSIASGVPASSSPATPPWINPAEVVLGFALALGALAALPLYTLEVERIWIFMTPFTAISAAWMFPTLHPSQESRRAVGQVLTGLCLQTVLVEWLLTTYW